MSMNTEQVVNALRSPRDSMIAVAGDVMLDRYLWGEAARLSPEAPVPVVRLASRRDSPGGAGNTALNLRGLDAPVSLMGVVGRDDEGVRLRALLADAGVELEHLVSAPGRGTTVKTRVFAGFQQVVRVDEDPEPEDGSPVTLLLERVRDFLAPAAALVISDYGKGGLPDAVCRALLAEARRRGIPALVDPKGWDFTRYTGASAITPNRQELFAALPTQPQDLAGLAAAGEALRGRLGLEFLLATLGEQGMLLVDAQGSQHFAVQAHEVYDVCGAGDTVVATLAWGLVHGLARGDAVALANRAAGQVVARRGVVACRREDLISALEGVDERRSFHSAMVADEAADRVRAWQRLGHRVVFTNGCFDLLHEGHLESLVRARALGDRLVLGLNSDASVRALKGPDRPVLPARERARLLAALDPVDLVVVFDAPTPIDLIARLAPDVLVKGADWAEADIVGAELVRARGGSVAQVPLVPGRSTSALLQRIRSQGPSGDGA